MMTTALTCVGWASACVMLIAAAFGWFRVLWWAALVTLISAPCLMYALWRAYP